MFFINGSIAKSCQYNDYRDIMYWINYTSPRSIRLLFSVFQRSFLYVVNDIFELYADHCYVVEKNCPTFYFIRMLSIKLKNANFQPFLDISDGFLLKFLVNSHSFINAWLIFSQFQPKKVFKVVEKRLQTSFASPVKLVKVQNWALWKSVPHFVVYTSSAYE